LRTFAALYGVPAGRADAMLETVMARGLGPASALPAIAILLGFTAVATLIAVRVFRWDEI
jgi:ABC-2 type transport system permease protein